MFLARVTITCSPEQHQTALDKLRQETVEVPSSFPGCERFSVAVDCGDEHTLHIFEEWTDAASFYAYQQSDYFSAAMALIGPCVVAPPDSAYYEASLVGP